MILTFDPNDVQDYLRFLQVKKLPTYRIRGRVAEFPDEYASRLGLAESVDDAKEYKPWPGLFDYQRDIASLAIRKRKFAVFADCGLGKTLIFLEFVRHALKALPKNRCALIVSPLMVCDQTMAECQKWYGDKLPVEQVRAADLNAWLASGKGRFGITNYDALKSDIQPGRLGCLVLDESSMLKSHYGKWGAECIRLGRGLNWKLAGTGTPAPNDRIEYANHAVFLNEYPNVNAFLARFFVNRGQTNERWELKPHALGPFYRALSHWSLFLTNPATYGWKDNVGTMPPIHVDISDVDLTPEQDAAVRKETGQLVATNAGGIGSRQKLARIAKGSHNGSDLPTNKPQAILNLLASFPDESAIVWCKYNDEQDQLAKLLPDAANIDGSTPHEKRLELIDDFKAGRRKVLLSKPKLLGFGLNLQIATRQIFSTLQDSYEEYYQAVKRSNRVGSKRPLHVHIPITDIERPMVDTVLRKAARVQADTDEQERIFREHSCGLIKW